LVNYQSDGRNYSDHSSPPDHTPSSRSEAFSDRSEAIARGDTPPPPVARLIGFDLISVKPGEAVIEFQATEAHANPMGTLHGGVLCDIADASMQ
jgi:acyl-coenzyme A thioesterase PaaI-like protein